MIEENNIVNIIKNDDYSKSKCVKIHNKYNKLVIEKTYNKITEIRNPVNNLVIPTLKEISNCKMEKYKVCELKKICSFYKIKNYSKQKKNELIVSLKRLANLNHYSVFIQKNARRFLVKTFLNNKSPHKTWIPSKRKEICKNDSDFYTMEPVEEIPLNQYICYVDENNCYWGFNILSLYNYFKHQYNISKNKNKINNPYTNLPFSSCFMSNFKHHVYISEKMGFHVELSIKDDENDEKNNNNEYILNQLIINNISVIEQHGYFLRNEWVSNLSKEKLIHFLRELKDIWCYRSQISPYIQRQICHPSGNPFGTINNQTIQLLRNKEHLEVCLTTHKIINNFITKGISYSDCGTGILYVLSALTLVSEDLANAYPWIYINAQP